MAVFAPMPRAMMTTATKAKPGLFRNSLSANFTFCINIVISRLRSGEAVSNFPTIHEIRKKRVINTFFVLRRKLVSIAENRCPAPDIRDETGVSFLDFAEFLIRIRPLVWAVQQPSRYLRQWQVLAQASTLLTVLRSLRIPRLSIRFTFDNRRHGGFWRQWGLPFVPVGCLLVGVG